MRGYLQSTDEPCNAVNVNTQVSQSCLKYIYHKAVLFNINGNVWM
jgi:hypothetical protein